jgi:dihydroflavonol-4-reductase
MNNVAMVTGGLGFLGDHLVRLLLQEQYAVRILDVGRPEARIEGVEYFAGSVTDRAAVRGAMQGVGWLFHLAGKASLWTYPRADFQSVNHLGTRIVLEEAERAGVARVVHTSSEVVFKDAVGPYARAKLLAEQEALAAVQRGLPVVIVNPAVPVGPGDRNLTPPARMLLGYLNGEYPGYVESVLNLVDARDVAEGTLRAAERGRVGERYVLGSVHLRLSELLALLEDITRLPMPRRRIPYFLAWGASAMSELIADHVTHRPPAASLSGLRIGASPVRMESTKAREELGVTFRPIRDSLTDAVAWFRQRGLLRREPRR